MGFSTINAGKLGFALELTVGKAWRSRLPNYLRITSELCAI